MAFVSSPGGESSGRCARWAWWSGLASLSMSSWLRGLTYCTHQTLDLIRPCTWHPVSDSRSAEISTNCPRAIARRRPTIPPLGRCPSSHRRRWRFPGQQCRGFPSRFRFYLPWALGVAGTIAAGALFLQRAPGLLVLVALPFLKGLAITAWSGNVNALIASAALFTWWAGEPHARRAAAVTAGAITAAIGAVKLGPSLFWVWIAGRRTPDAPLSGFLAIAGLTGLALVALGPAPFQEYLQIATASASDPSAMSLLGVLKGVGVPAGVASMLWVSTVVASGNRSNHEPPAPGPGLYGRGRRLGVADSDRSC